MIDDYLTFWTKFNPCIFA